MKTKKAKKATKSTRKAIPYVTIHKLAEQGFGALEIAKKTNRVIPGKDGAHSIRAILSRMRSVGYKLNGKTVKLKVKRVGFDPKPVRKATVKKTVVQKPDGKTLAAGGAE
jgi:ribulose bisphosphate carboxylase small subunit